MKKYLCLLLALLLILAPAGCSSRAPESDGTSAESVPTASTRQEPDAEPPTASGAAPASAPASQTADDPAEEATETAGSTSVLIAYFSWAENAELDGEVDAVASPSVNDPGNVQQLAGWIQAETGGDLFSIQVTDPYPSDWDACGELEAVYALNDSPAADALWAQLPLTLDVEDFSTNEKVFYPPNELDTADTPLAEGGAGTLAYYAPWGDVVLFYDSFSRNAGLYELGEIVSGTEHIAQMRGSITVEALE